MMRIDLKKMRSAGEAGAKIFILLFLILFFNLGLIAASEAVTLAKVNNVPITDQSVQEAVQSYLRKIGHRELSRNRMAILRKEMLKKLIEEELLYQDGLARDLMVSDEALNTGLIQIRNRFQSKALFDAALSREALNFEDIKIGVYRSILIQEVWSGFSQMSESDRSHRLKEIAQGANIQIIDNPLLAFAPAGDLEPRLLLEAAEK